MFHGTPHRNRGTEYVKSPEMLVVANADKKGRDTYDRRRRALFSGLFFASRTLLVCRLRQVGRGADATLDGTITGKCP